MAQKPTDAAKSLGEAIDEIVLALSSLDELSRTTAIRAACEHLKIIFSPGVETTYPIARGARTDTESSISVGRLPDIRELKEEKQPSSANEMAALVAYYLSEIATERKDDVELEDIVKYFKQAKFPLPKRPEFLLTNAKYAGYFESVGDGKYRLNPVGYNLVVHNLPRGAPTSVKGPRRTKRRPSKGKGKRRA